MNNNNVYIPLIGNGEGLSIDDVNFINKKAEELSTLFDGSPRAWHWSDPIREGVAGLVHRFDSSNMETERIQSLIGLSDEQFIDAVQAGRVNRDEWPLGRMPRERRDAILQGELAKRKNYQDIVNQTADYFAPVSPHAQPEGILENIAYHGLGLIPNVLAGAAEYSMLGPLGMGVVHTIEGNNNAAEQVYSNLRNQGQSIDEARLNANNPLANLADLGIRGVTNWATMNALGKIGNNINPQWTEGSISPIAQTLRNIGSAGVYSGTGASAEQALTNYRSNIDNDLEDLTKTGLIAGVGTAAMGAVSALTQMRKIWNAQKQYNASRPIDTTGRWLPPDDRMLGSGSEPTPPDNMPPTPETPNAPNSDALALPDANSRWNDVTGKYGFEPNTPPEGIVNAIQYGQISPQDAAAMLNELGLSPEATQGMLDAAKQARVNDLRANHPMQTHGMTKTRPEVTRPKLRPEIYTHNLMYPTFEDPILDILPSDELLDMHHMMTEEGYDLSVGRSPKVNSIDLPEYDLLETHSMSTNTPLLQPPISSQNMMDAIHIPPMSPALMNRNSQQTGRTGTENTQIPSATQTEGFYNEESRVGEELQGLNGLIPYIPQENDIAPVNEYTERPHVQPEMSIDDLRKKLFDEMLNDNLLDEDSQERIEGYSVTPDNAQTRPMLPTGNMQNIPALLPGQHTQANIQPFPAQTGFDPRNHDFDLKTNNGLTQPKINTNRLDITGSQVNTHKGLTAPEVNILNALTKPEISTHKGKFSTQNIKTRGGQVLMTEPEVFSLDTDNPILQPPKYNKTPQVTPSPKDWEDDIVSSMQVDHMGEIHNLDILTDSYADPAEDKEWGQYLEFLDDDGNTVAFYMPYIDKFILEQGSSKKGWARNIEDTLRKNLPEHLKAAGLLDDNGKLKPDGNEEYRTNKYGYNPAWKPKEKQTSPKKAETNKKSGTIEPFDLKIGADTYTVSPAQNGKLAIYINFRTGGLTQRSKLESEFYNGKLQRRDGKPLNQREKEIEKQIIQYLGDIRQDEDENIPNLLPSPEPEKKLGKINKDFGVNANGKKYRVKAEKNGLSSVVELLGKNFNIEKDTGYIYDPNAQRLLKLRLDNSGQSYYSTTLDEQEKQLEQEINATRQKYDSLISGSSDKQDKVPQVTPAPEEENEAVQANSQDIIISEPFKVSANNYIYEIGRTKDNGEALVYIFDKYGERSNTDFVFKNGELFRKRFGYKGRKLEYLKDFGESGEKLEAAIKAHLQGSKPEAVTETKPVQQKQDSQKSNEFNLAPYLQIAEQVKELVISGQPITNQQLLDIAAKAFGGTKGEGAFSPKDAYDAMEMGVNLALKEMQYTPNNDTFNADIDDLHKSILPKLPTQSNRTEEQNEFQQFSTPPHIAYLVNWLANIHKGDIVLEPSAGLGGLAMFAKNAGATLILNELSDRRFALLNSMDLGTVFQENAEHIGNILMGRGYDKVDKRPNKVIMNPPFSSTAGRIKDKRDSMNAMKHLESALQILNTNGRLVIILGGSMNDSHPCWKHIKNKYNVRANVTLDGSNYYKYGTTYDIAIAVIDKTTPTPENGTITGSFENVEDMFDALKDIRDDAPLFDPFNTSGKTTKKSSKKKLENSQVKPEQPKTEFNPVNSMAAEILRMLDAEPDRGAYSIKKLRSSLREQNINNDEFDKAFNELWDKYFIHPTLDDYSSDPDNFIDKNTGLRFNLFRIVEPQSLENMAANITAKPVKENKAPEKKSEMPKPEKSSPVKEQDLISELADKIAQDKKVINALKNSDEEGVRLELKNALGEILVKNILNPKYNLSPADRVHIIDLAYSMLKDKKETLSTQPEADTTKTEAQNQPEQSKTKTPAPAEKNEAKPAETKTDKKSEASNKKTESATTKKNSEPTTPKALETKSDVISDTEAGSKSGVKIGIKSDEEKTSEAKADEKDAEKYEAKQNDDPDEPETQELSINSRYRSSITGFKHHPGDLDESTAMKSVAPPPASYMPNLPARIQEKGLLSDAQIEPVIYAGMSFRQRTPDGKRRGYYIGDGTGVGKGREISAIIMDQLRNGHGKGKAVWISDKHSLIKDAKRDWSGIGNNPDDIFAHEKITDKKLAEHKEGILFSAYSYMESKDRIAQLKKWLGDDFDGVIILDECHNVNNVLTSKGKFGKKKPSVAATNTRDFVAAFPEARVVYVSATGATEVKNLAMLDRLGLWGGTSQFTNAEDFVTSISKGGTAAMELVARDMKAMGLFNARSLSMRAGPYGGDEDVTFRTLEHDLTPHQEAIYDKLAECWQVILKNISVAIEMCGGEDSKSKGSAVMKFWSAHQKFFNQIIITLQTPAVIKDVEKQLQSGNSVVIQLTNTFEAAQEQAVAKLKSKSKENDELSYEDLDISPKETMLQFLEQCFPVELIEDYEDDNGNIKTRPVLDSNGKPVINLQAKAMRDDLIEMVNSIRQFPESPLDMIIERFGTENVAEITGRSRRFIRDNNGKRVEDKRNENKRSAEINDFNEGRKRILIFSEKGGTGASYHASNDYKNKQKRIHYLLQPGWRADKAIQGLGRTNRSNQAHKPEYVLVTTDIPGQKRFLSTIARRLEQLGALSSGERKSQTQGLFSEDDNLEASYINDAVKDLFTNIFQDKYSDIPDAINLLEQLGFDPQKMFSLSGGKNKMPNVPQFLNRILSMKVAEQKKLFAHFEECIQARKEFAARNGTLDIRAENVRAQKINILQNHVIAKNREYGTETRYVELELVQPIKARTFDNVLKKGNGNTEFYMTDKGDIVAAVPRKSSKTDIDTGETSQLYTLYYVSPKRTESVPEHILFNQGTRQQTHYTRLSEDEAHKIWEQQVNELPKTYIQKKHMLTGALLPVWKQLGSSAPRIQRVVASDGQSFLGRIIPDSELKSTLSQLNFQYKGETYTAETLLEKLNTPGMIATLTNNAKLKSVRVNGEKRIEIFNIDFYLMDALKRNGAIIEIINSEKRVFLPVGNTSILEDLIKNAPVVRVTQRNVMGEAADEINNQINSDNPYNMHAIHPFFRPDPENNPYINSSRYAFSNPETEKRYQNSKKFNKPKIWHRISQVAHSLWKGFSDFPELSGNDRLIKAQELLRKLKRERKADVQETVQRLRAALKDLNTPEDFDLFSRAMQLLDLKETIELDPEALLPWGYTPESLYYDYKLIMQDVDNNPRVADAIEKAEILNADIDRELIEAADLLQMFDIRDKLKRKHYFRHVVLEYYHQAGGAQPRPTMKNPQRRGYLKHREGSSKDISSDWIMAMGEVWTRMNDDIKIIKTLTKLRKEYDIIEDLKQQAFAQNYKNALAEIMNQLQDLPELTRDTEAHRLLDNKLLHRQAQAVARLFKLAQKGDLPAGDNHEWLDFLGRFADAGQLENLDDDMLKQFTRYIGWLASLEQPSRARSTAQRFIRGDISKQAGLKEILGSNYIQWQDLIPDDYELWSPSDSRLVFSANTVPENILMMAQENLDELLGVPISDLGKAMTSGGNKQLWCIPTKLADTLNSMGKKQPQGMLAQAMRKGMNAFKRYILTTPANGRIFKYNWRNFFGDLEAVLQGNPAALWYFKRACKDLTDYMLRGGETTGMLAEFVKRGGALTTEFSSELENWQDLKEFARLFEDKKHINPLKLSLNLIKGYMKIASTLTNFRESILRYAAFLAYYNQILANDRTAPFYGMSKPKEVEALNDDIYDMAFKLANENLGAYDQVSQNTQWLRDNSIMTFISWMEVNFKRSIQMYKNIWSGNSYLEHYIKKHGEDFIRHFGGGNGNKPPRNNNGSVDDDGDPNNWDKIRKLLGKSPVYIMRLAITLAMAAPLMIILGIINSLNGENEEKLTPDVRNTPHLTLNTNEFTGEVLYLGRLGSAFDFFQTIGINNIGRDLKDLFDGKTTLLEIAGNIVSGPVNKLISNVNPFAKAAIEMTTGRRLFPDFRRPSSIRDNAEYLASTLALDWYYDALTGKPHEPASNLASSLANTQKPDEAAYWYILAKKKEFQEKVLGNTYDGYTQTKRGEALYNAKRAAAFGDRNLMRKFIREYYRAGGDYEGLESSANSMDPLFGLNDDEQTRFLKWLPKEERRILRKANRFFIRISTRLGV